MVEGLSQQFSLLFSLVPSEVDRDREESTYICNPEFVRDLPSKPKGVGYSVSIEAKTPPTRPCLLVWKEVTVLSSSADDSASHPRSREENIALRFCHVMRFLKTNLCSHTDSNDESLQRYKESLGLGGGKDLSDPNDRRVCIIKKLSMQSPGRPAVTIDLAAPGSETTLKDKPFKIKEGSKFTMVAEFNVQHEILSGLQYVQIVKRKGIKVSKDSEMLVSQICWTRKLLAVI